MTAAPDPTDTVLAAWKTSSRVTVFLIEQVPPSLWKASVPGVARRTVRMIAAHIHNSRCSWIRTLGKERRVPVPARVDPRTVSRKELVTALKRSAPGIGRLLEIALECGGTIPAPSTYAWRNLPLDAGHILSYFVAHEGHHRGQIVLIARQLGHRLPLSVTGGLWAWTRLS